MTHPTSRDSRVITTREDVVRIVTALAKKRYGLSYKEYVFAIVEGKMVYDDEGQDIEDHDLRGLLALIGFLGNYRGGTRLFKL